MSVNGLSQTPVLVPVASTFEAIKKLDSKELATFSFFKSDALLARVSREVSSYQHGRFVQNLIFLFTFITRPLAWVGLTDYETYRSKTFLKIVVKAFDESETLVKNFEDEDQETILKFRDPSFVNSLNSLFKQAMKTMDEPMFGSSDSNRIKSRLLQCIQGRTNELADLIKTEQDIENKAKEESQKNIDAFYEEFSATFTPEVSDKAKISDKAKVSERSRFSKVMSGAGKVLAGSVVLLGSTAVATVTYLVATGIWNEKNNS